jgi:hypothetical protein
MVCFHLVHLAVLRRASDHEALWIEFKATSPFAIKVYVGGVNAISGLPAKEDKWVGSHRQALRAAGKSVKDYVVVPGQHWFDGIADKDGTVRQFVAKLLGQGYTVEAQISGAETKGGLQFEIIPGKVKTPTPIVGGVDLAQVTKPIAMTGSKRIFV